MLLLQHCMLSLVAAATISILMHYKTFLRISTYNVRDNFQEIGNANFTPHRTLSSLWFILQKKRLLCVDAFTWSYYAWHRTPIPVLNEKWRMRVVKFIKFFKIYFIKKKSTRILINSVRPFFVIVRNECAYSFKKNIDSNLRTSLDSFNNIQRPTHNFISFYCCEIKHHEQHFICLCAYEFWLHITPPSYLSFIIKFFEMTCDKSYQQDLGGSTKRVLIIILWPCVVIPWTFH